MKGLKRSRDELQEEVMEGANGAEGMEGSEDEMSVEGIEDEDEGMFSEGSTDGEEVVDDDSDEGDVKRQKLS